jgi:hypothetical protein
VNYKAIEAMKTQSQTLSELACKSNGENRLAGTWKNTEHI